MATISQEVNIEMLEKLADGTFKIKYPKTKADLVIGLTKEHVGLGNVQNYEIATKAEAEAGSISNKYMTPLRVKEAIDALGVKSVRGTYTGNGSTSDRKIIIGKAPKLVIIFCTSRSRIWIIMDGKGAMELTSGSSNQITYRDSIKTEVDGFTVSYTGNANEKDWVYDYFAFV